MLAAWRPVVYASHTLDGCGQTCAGSDGQCFLGKDLSCTSSNSTSFGVKIDGGSDFDFKGHKIDCSGCSSSASAVLVTASNSIINDSIGRGGGVLGLWGFGINCQLNSGSLVQDVYVQGSDVGISGCRKGLRCSVAAMSIGISNTSIGSTDYIKNSYVFGGAPIGIKLAGSGAGLVDHNVIANASSDSILTTATTSASLTISSNTLFPDGGGTLIHKGSTAPVTSGNVCGASQQTTCAACIAASDCEAPETFFVGP
jgi:hypothetical protein